MCSGPAWELERWRADASTDKVRPKKADGPEFDPWAPRGRKGEPTLQVVL